MKRILFGLFCSLCITQFSVAQKVKDSAPNTQKSAPNTEKSASNNGVKSPGAEQNVKNHNLEVAKNLEIFNALYKNLDLMYPWGLEESDTTERLHFHFSLSCIGEGNGNPLQCS